jgi:hypothetical protein
MQISRRGISKKDEQKECISSLLIYLVELWVNILLHDSYGLFDLYTISLECELTYTMSM